MTSLVGRSWHGTDTKRVADASLTCGSLATGMPQRPGSCSDREGKSKIDKSLSSCLGVDSILVRPSNRPQGDAPNGTQ